MLCLGTLIIYILGWWGEDGGFFFFGGGVVTCMVFQSEQKEVSRR